ncbi:MAG: 6-phosphogluconolactonase [bacterium]|nr:6-phosphogluconolactonase [bacterium]
MATIQRYLSAAAVAEAAAQFFAQKAQEAIAAQGRFTVALSGGSTPKAMFTLLAQAPFAEQVDWPKVHIFWGDERTVPPDHPDSNYKMAAEALLKSVPLNPANVHRMEGELDPVEAAVRYEDVVRRELGDSPRFDLILLGMGDDGHTASLFPGTAALDETTRLVVANWVEKLNTWRITLSRTVLNNAANIVFLVVGEAKAAVLLDVVNGPYQPEVYPSQFIEPTKGTLIWMVDEAAASLL